MNKRTIDFISKFLGDLSKEGLKHGTEVEYRRCHPVASDDDIQTMFDAGEKAGAVPHNLEHAKLILSDNVFTFTATSDSPFAQGSKRFAAFRQWPVPNRNSFPSVGVLAMARTMQQFATDHPDDTRELMAGALALEKRALDAIKAGLPELTLD